MSRNSRGAWNAIKAVLVVAVGSFALSFLIMRFMHGMDPCHSVNTQLVASPDGSFSARKVEVSCKQQNGTQHQIQIAVAERNNKTGKSQQYANVFACKGITASEVSVAWTGQRQLAVDFPQSRVGLGDISAQQPHFKDVEIQYGEKK